MFVFLLVSYGITNIIVFGSIFESFRGFWNNINPNFLGKLFSCPMCTSTWVGFILSAVFQYMGYNTPLVDYGIENMGFAIFLDGCLASGGVWLLHTLQEYFEG
jgi:hypothetical protein